MSHCSHIGDSLKNLQLFDLKTWVETFLLSVFLVEVLDRKLVFVADTDVACIVALKKVEHGWHVFVLLLHNSFLEKDVYLLKTVFYFG